jgi:aerobic-type carbon monoxide dehydrogenase small subunit (CoxS/CutS family)
MIMSAVALLARRPNPTDEEIIQGMNGNICRCGSHPRIVAAIRRAASLEAASRRAAGAGR